MQKYLMTYFFKNRTVKNRSFMSISLKSSFFIQCLLLLSASLSVHSVLALPLSSVLEENYQAVEQSDEFAGHFNTNSILKSFVYKQYTHSKLQVSLQTLLQQSSQEHLLFVRFITSINELPVHMLKAKVQSKAFRLYQEQLTTHLHILGSLHALYTQKNSYQAKLQHQKTFS